jgi:hypothetical protein
MYRWARRFFDHLGQRPGYGSCAEVAKEVSGRASPFKNYRLAGGRRSLSMFEGGTICMAGMVCYMDAGRRTFKRFVEFAVIFLASADSTGHVHGAAFL